jgi:hypothetical protein
MTEIEIVQDSEFDELDGGVGAPLAVFWAKGHGHDPRKFIRAVLDYCLFEDADIPAIAYDDAPIETWQQNVSHQGAIEYRRDTTPPESSRSPRFPITVLDLERRTRGGFKCMVDDCHEPWSVGTSARVVVEPTPDGDAPPSRYMSVRMWFCREHRRHLPEPSYRVCMVPVGAEIVLPGPQAAAS